MSRVRTPSPALKRKTCRTRSKDRSRWETLAEWEKRVGAPKWAELRRWQTANRWHPHQLRHSAGTIYRREADFETAKIVLAHRSDTITALYAERDERRAEEAVARIGYETA